jgi:ribosome-associated toxin RatA of RatAB toxin-antitoxin module
VSKVLECSAELPYLPQQMFDLVNDIEAYPQFMQGCAKAKIIAQGENWLTAQLTLAKAGFQQQFTTRNQLDAPAQINMVLVDGPFKKFHGIWRFQPMENGGCRVSFHLEYEFANLLLALAANPVMHSLMSEQVDTMCKRAHAIYQKN